MNVYPYYFLFWLLLIASTSCNNNNKIVLKKTPSTQYEIEYQDSSITINYVFKERGGGTKSFTLFYREGQYFDEDDSCIFLSVKDTIVCEYDSHFNSMHIMRFRKLDENLYATENFIVNYQTNDVLGNMKGQKSIRNGIHYYYDSTYHILGIHRFDEVDDFILKK